MGPKETKKKRAKKKQKNNKRIESHSIEKESLSGQMERKKEGKVADRARHFWAGLFFGLLPEPSGHVYHATHTHLYLLCRSPQQC